MGPQLPDKPSELLSLALFDLEAVEKDPRYSINMGSWHEPLPDGTCRVCLAGGVMARTLQMPLERELRPPSFDHDARRRLCAIESMRRGALEEALHYLDISFPFSKLPPTVKAVPYAGYRDEFFEYGRNLVKTLKEAGY